MRILLLFLFALSPFACESKRTPVDPYAGQDHDHDHDHEDHDHDEHDHDDDHDHHD